MNRIEIPFSLPSLNDYIRECNKHRCQGSKHKKQVQEDIGWFINKLPEYKKPIKIHFIWVENKKPRDFDNVCFAKKYILDAMVKAGKLKDDNRNIVKGFRDDFAIGDSRKVIIEIEEELEREKCQK